MGFGGTAGMNASIKANAALRRDRDRIFERTTEYRWNDLGQDELKPVCSPAVSKRNREQFWAEKKREEREGWVKTVIVLAAVVLLAYFYFQHLP